MQARVISFFAFLAERPGWYVSVSHGPQWRPRPHVIFPYLYTPSQRIPHSLESLSNVGDPLTAENPCRRGYITAERCDS